MKKKFDWGKFIFEDAWPLFEALLVLSPIIVMAIYAKCGFYLRYR